MDLVRCGRCAKQIPPSSRYCRRCGCRRDDAATASVAAPRASSAAAVVATAVLLMGGALLLTIIIGVTGATPELAAPTATVSEGELVTAAEATVAVPDEDLPTGGFDAEGRWVGHEVSASADVRGWHVGVALRPGNHEVTVARRPAAARGR